MRAMYLLLASIPAALIAAPQAQAQDFSGPRVEATIGYDTPRYDDGIASTPNSLDGLRVGGAVGYDVELGETFVIGAEAGIGFDLAGSQEATAGNTTVRVTTGYDLDVSLRAGAKVTPRTLLYVKGGWANSEFRAKTTVVGTTSTTVTSVKDSDDAWRIGAGVEQMIDDHFYAKAEYRYSDYGDDVTRHQVLVGAGYRF